MSRTKHLLFAVVLLLVPCLAFAQGFQVGNLAGAVTDQTGGALPGVTVTAKSQERGFARTEVTDERGRFRFAQLPLGQYTVTAELSGFQTVTLADNRVEAEKTNELDIRLALAAETAVITVSGDAPVVDRTNTTATTRVSTEEFEKAPVGRDYQSLVNFAPGVVDANDDDGNPNVNGALDSNNVYLFDGVDTTDPVTGTFGSNLNFEAIEEVNVYTSGVSAEYGRATGAVVNVITKSGTNEFEGSLKTLFTNDKWNEQNDTVNQVTGASLAREKQDNLNTRYSATLGGPIVRDRAWFFGAYEQYKPESALATTSVTNEEYQQNLDIGLENYRLTFQITPSHNIWGKYASDPITGFVFGGLDDTDLGTLLTQEQGGDNWAVQYTGVLGSKTTLEAHVSDMNQFINVTPFLSNESPHYSFEDGRIYNGGYYSLNDRRRQQATLAGSYFASFGDNSHDIKAGVDLQRSENTLAANYTGGILYYDATFDPFTGVGEPDTRLVFDDVPPEGSSDDILSAYVRDKFTIGDRLFFEVGARFENQTAENDVNEEILDTTTVAPRLSMSFDVLGNGRSVITGTAGRFYSSIIQGYGNNFAKNANAANYNVEIWGPAYGLPANSGWVLVDRVETSGSLVSASRGIDPTYADEITIGLQQQLGQTMAVGARAIWREFGDLIDDYYTFDEDGDIITDFRNYDSAEREYQGLQLSFEKRFSNNWSALANYTYSETTGNHFSDYATSLDDFTDYDCFVQDASVGVNGVIPCSEVTGARALSGSPSFDIPHLVNVLGTWSTELGPTNLALGAAGRWHSGITYSKSRTAFVIDQAGEPRSDVTYTYWYEGRGSDRVDSIWSFDTSAELTFDLASFAEMGIKAEVFNVTDNQDQVLVDRTLWCGTTSATCQATQAAYGAATSRGSFQAPRSYRLTALIRF